MYAANVKPTFGGRLQDPSYYAAVTAYIKSLNNTTTQRQIAAMLNSAGYRSPTGKPFVRSTVANFLRKRSV